MPGNEGPRRSESKHGFRNAVISGAAVIFLGAISVGAIKGIAAIDSNKRTFQALVNDCPDSKGFTQVGKEIIVGNEILKLTSVVVPQDSNFEFAICVLNDSRYIITDLTGRAVEIYWRGNTFSDKLTGEKLFDVIEENKPKLSDKYTFESLKNYLNQKGFSILPANEIRKITPNELESRDRVITITLLVIAAGLVVGIPIIAKSMTMSNELLTLKNTVVANTDAANIIADLRNQTRQAKEIANNERIARQAIEAQNRNLSKAVKLNKKGGWNSRRS